MSVEFNEDAFAVAIGVDGEGTRSKSNNSSGRVTVTLMQSSQTNLLLTALHELDKATGDGISPLIVKDGSGTSLYTAESAWIARHPTAGFGREADTREWFIDTDFLIAVTGGN